MASTHQVLNQPPALTGHNAYLSDSLLVSAVQRGAPWAHEMLSELGSHLGSEEARGWARDADRNEPVLHTHDRFGNRRDEVMFHPAWHSLMRTSVAYGVHSVPWTTHSPGAHLARAALMMVTAENELGHTCPISMTYSGVPALRQNAELAREWEPRLTSTEYDPSFRPASQKGGALMGMGMTEKQGGSDVRANTTRAEHVSGAEYLITGHKWFCSAPMCDAFLILAQAPRGLSCFFLPRWMPDGKKNAFTIQRLKDKLGNRSNASSEIEFDQAHAWLVGEEGRGVQTIIEMVNHTRLDCCLGAAALMRRALVEALHHAQHRCAFGKRLKDQPLMSNVLLDLTLESEAATLLALRVAQAFDGRATDPQDRGFARIGTAIAKFWLCKRAPFHVVEALECLGGNGYVEDSDMPRLYREAPLYSIWEGAGNVICLDVLRAWKKDPIARDALAAELDSGRGLHPALDGLIDAALNPPPGEEEARRYAMAVAVALQGILMVQHAEPSHADAFLSASRGRPFGTLSGGSYFTE